LAPSAIEVERLSHRYGDRTALDGVDLAVGTGEIVGLLGPNGGGKTTLFRVLATLMAPSAGAARVLGHDVVREAAAVRRRIGVVFQSPGLDRKLTAAENLRCQGALYGLDRARTRERADAMLARVGLADRARDRVETLSGGQRRRVELAKGLLHGPELLLLDEPSTGLDPGTRRDLWTYLRGTGVTSLLTTHLMEEAELCDRVVILDRGKVVAEGTPDALRAAVGGEVLTVESDDAEGLRAGLRERFGIDASVVEGRVRFERADARAFLPQLFGAFGGAVRSVSLGRPTLEDVFILRTGHRFWSEGR
jgi:ABC-2 type transport system ATP-binding protein